MKRFTTNATLIIQFACSPNSLYNPWFLISPGYYSRPTLSSAEAPAGYPNKNSNNGKIESPRGTMGRGKRREPLFSRCFPFPSCPARFLFVSPSFPATQRGLCGEDRSSQETSKTILCKILRGKQGVLWGMSKWRIEENSCLTFLINCQIH